ncbi:MAG TPA: hypothetical protein PKL30_26140 [Leptospiraceae bacterium]|nr:hypothetical protein [Leptospiraceae bacterium]HNH58327.1 hypothetical protein [Leptospiraceae bacterium]HNN82383.1 hypothetical protein [Leptospiraceae bacterium]
MRKSIPHGILGLAAICVISVFWITTIVSELFLERGAVIIVKQLIASYGLVMLIIVMGGLGISGNLLGKKRKGNLIEKKKRRMPIIAMNGFLIMIPSALFLNDKAANGEFDNWFYMVQTIELIVGAIQITLLGLSFRDGLKLSGRLRSNSLG